MLCGRLSSPSGLWNYNQLVGATVKIKSSPGCNIFSPREVQKEYTIKDIYVRVSLDGKGITVIELEGLEGKVFTWRDLEVTRIKYRVLDTALCGEFLVNESIVGYNVSGDPSFATIDGVSVIDDKGNIIQGRYIRFTGADVEDVNTDPDNITDISINVSGDVL